MTALRLDGEAIIRAEAGAASAILHRVRSPAVVAEVVQDAQSHADWLVQGAKDRIPPGPIACAKGCAYCCHLRVVTTIPEVLRITQLIRETKNDHEIHEIQARIEAHGDATRDLDVPARRRLRLPCPLLRGGHCMVYEVRPMSCRGWNSIDLAGCERDFHHPEAASSVPVYEPQYQVNVLVQQGLENALESAGLQHDRVELTAALGVALTAPEAARRWLSGDRLFEPAAG